MNMYVLQVKPGYEETAAHLINKKGCTAMCPTEEMYIRSLVLEYYSLASTGRYKATPEGWEEFMRDKDNGVI